MSLISRYPWTFAWIFVYLASLALTFIQSFGTEISYYLVVLLIGIPLTIGLISEWSFFLPSRAKTVKILLPFVLIWIGTLFLVRANFGWYVFHPMNTISLICIGAMLGFWLAGEIEKSGHLIPVCILGALVDIWSVFQGPSRHVGEQIQSHQEAVSKTTEFIAPPVSSFLLVHWPHPGAFSMTPIFGFGDLVFIGLFLASSRRFGINTLKSYILILFGLFAALGAALYFETPIPALPFICGFFLLGNLTSLSLNRKEWMITILITVLILLVLGIKLINAYISDN